MKYLLVLMTKIGNEKKLSSYGKIAHNKKLSVMETRFYREEQFASGSK
jgi:hypothetical protein